MTKQLFKLMKGIFPNGFLLDEKRLKELRQSLENWNETDNPQFAKLIEDYLDISEIEIHDLAERLGVSVPTVRHWAEGKLHPHSSTIPSKIQALKEVLDVLRPRE